MYGFEQFLFELSMENVLKKVSDIVLWRHYLGVDFRIGGTMCAPYRTDKKPSFSIFYGTSGKLMYKDFGGNGSYGDIINYIQMVEGLNFWDALLKINDDFSLGLGDKGEAYKKGSKLVQGELIKFEKDFIYTKGNVPLFQISTRLMNREDSRFWSSYGITQGILKRYNVYAVQNLYINKRLAYTYDELNPCYAYYFPKTGHMKCYFPFSKTRRFMGNVNNYEDVQGYWQCDVKGRPDKLLVLTKSMKDCMLLRELGYDAMAINGEAHYFHVDFIRHIKKYYKIIYSLYDPDKTGFAGARHLWTEHRIPFVFIPKRYRGKCKDISDICKEYSKEETMKVMKELLGEVYFNTNVL